MKLKDFSTVRGNEYSDTFVFMRSVHISTQCLCTYTYEQKKYVFIIIRIYLTNEIKRGKKNSDNTNDQS